MKQYEKIKNGIASCDSALEMAGYLEGIRVAAIIYCSKEYPDEISKSKNGGTEITIYGMQYYLEREVNETYSNLSDFFRGKERK